MSNLPAAPSPPAPSPAVSTARGLDLAGRHGEALEILRAASKQGDAGAMSDLGHRLLIGDRAPKLPQHALRILAEAARRDEPRALARMAALTAAGAYVKQDWAGALQLLGRAAAAGDPSAQGQLTSLRPAGTTAADWMEMATRVDLQLWLQPATQVRLHDNVRRMPGMVSPGVCKWLISRAPGLLEPALVYDSVIRAHQVHQMRTNTMACYNYANIDVVQYLLQARMAMSCGYPMQNFEMPTVLHYSVGQQITPHFDFIDAQAEDYAQQIREHGQRMITFLLYLNDDYEGGETTFPELGIVNRGSTGDGLYFVNAYPDLKPDRRMLHTGSPPTAGEKWIVTQFIVSKALRP
jgi:prolyl 4-hydroxylase